MKLMKQTGLDRLRQLIEFLKTIERFKLIERSLVASDLKRVESYAEHVWHLLMFLLVFDRDLPPELDRLKLLKLALVHDLPEIYAGDTLAFDTEGRKGKKEREQAAASRLFGELPPDLGHEFQALWEEFEARETAEAKLVHALDKLQPILQNLCAEGKPWRDHQLTYEIVDEYKRPYMTDPLSQKLYALLLNEGKTYLTSTEE